MARRAGHEGEKQSRTSARLPHGLWGLAPARPDAFPSALPEPPFAFGSRIRALSEFYVTIRAFPFNTLGDTLPVAPGRVALSLGASLRSSWPGNSERRARGSNDINRLRKESNMHNTPSSSDSKSGPQNFIFGYGSLIEDESREITTPAAVVAWPARVESARSWTAPVLWRFPSAAGGTIGECRSLTAAPKSGRGLPQSKTLRDRQGRWKTN